MFDVIVSGLNVVDILLNLPEDFQSGHKHEVENIVIQGGAPAGNGASAMASLGLNTAFLGYLGENSQSSIAKKELQRFNINTSLMLKDPKAVPATALVQVDSQGERTVFYSTNGYHPLSKSDIQEAWVKNTKLVYVDGYDVEGNIELLALAKKNGIPSVVDLEAGNKDDLIKILLLGTHVILPLEAAKYITNIDSPYDCLIKLATMTDSQLLITDGKNGSWALYNSDVIHQPSYNVDVVDTTGCGDSYHAAYAYGLLKGFDIKKRMKFATAFSAIVATHFGGRTYFPTENEVNNFIKKQNLGN